jgi:hypothetical protein
MLTVNGLALSVGEAGQLHRTAKLHECVKRSAELLNINRNPHCGTDNTAALGPFRVSYT